MALIKVAQQAERDPKVCLKMAKKDQLCAIALMKRKQILKGLLKMVEQQHPLEALI